MFWYFTDIPEIDKRRRFENINKILNDPKMAVYLRGKPEMRKFLENLAMQYISMEMERKSVEMFESLFGGQDMLVSDPMLKKKYEKYGMYDKFGEKEEVIGEPKKEEKQEEKNTETQEDFFSDW